MNAKTEKRLGVMAAFLLTAAMFIAPNPIQQQQKFHFLSMTEEAAKMCRIWLFSHKTTILIRPFAKASYFTQIFLNLF